SGRRRPRRGGGRPRPAWPGRMGGVGSVTASEARLVALAAEAERGPRSDGLYALWLTLRAAEALLPPHPVSIKNHRRRLVALEHRLRGLALPAPPKPALPAPPPPLQPP